MGTLVVFNNIFPRYRIAFASNRDERLDRLSESPGMRDWEHRIFAPKDMERGGTWNGVNGHGVFAALTNRPSVTSVPDRVSRGELVMRALRHKSAERAFEEINRLPGSDYNGFYMVVGDKNKMFLLKGDGKVIESTIEGDGILVVTNHGVGRVIGGDHSLSVQNVLNVCRNTNITEQEPSVGVLRVVLDIHGDPYFGTCIDDPIYNYGTRSSSIVLLEEGVVRDHWQYIYRERSRFDPYRPICKEPFYYLIRYPIVYEA
ncbi:MAG: NRDE family protein [bacterium]|nr:NRDE family protein [bacterium]